MSRASFRVVGLVAGTLMLGLVAGCATNNELAAVRQQAQEAKDAADRANRTAAEAASAAREAQAAAAAARDAANAARDASTRTGEKVERAFKKSMQK